jgi:glycerophosphoryl diester phosphodiesterase
MNIKKTASEKIIITAHRGEAGGNVPCNTIPAYDAAVRHGADMIEVDANISADGTLFSFHPKMEKRHLGLDCSLPLMHDEEIKALRYLNYDRDATQFGIPTLDEIFARYKNRCFINIDKFWLYPKEITDLIRKHDMVDQIVVKTAPKKELFDLIEEYAPEIAYLPILKNVDGGVHEELMSRNINYVGAELVFNTLDCEIGGTEYIDRLHADNKLVWANAIIYNYKAQLSAGHSDDSSIEIDPETGWGWLADRGYDIIQTDWTLAMRIYLESTGRLFKK